MGISLSRTGPSPRDPDRSLAERQAGLPLTSTPGPVKSFVLLHRVVNFEVSDLDTVHRVIYA